MKILKAKNTDLENIVVLDKEMIGTDRRKEEIGEVFDQRRWGTASALLSHMTEMHKVFEANGFTKSGLIDNMDEGDPEIVYFIEKRRAN